ncbi:MAG: GDSL-type esterase/lipase family protein [bacterium]|nr:GDSL-type esterase/lipase family protein [bacterium]
MSLTSFSSLLELHNIAELDTAAGYPGPLVRRIPKAVVDQLENGALVAGDTTLCELRFVVERGRRLAIVLTSLSGSDLFVYRGDFVQNHVRLPANGLYRHVLDFETSPFAKLRAEVLSTHAFAPQVWRIVLDGPMLFHGVDLMGCAIRPPHADEKPAKRWLTYGSSITHGYSPVTRMQCYVAQTARRLGVDVLNLGLSGACVCEPVFADYLASRDDWDFITCELGVNMRNSFTPDEFARRARYLAETLTTRRPGKPVVLITPFPSAADVLSEPDAVTHTVRAFAAALRDIAAKFAARGVHLIEGADILSQFSDLTCDLVHPGTEGHTLMAENLAARLRTIITR